MFVHGISLSEDLFASFFSSKIKVFPIAGNWDTIWIWLCLIEILWNVLNKSRTFYGRGQFGSTSSACFKEKSDPVFCTHLHSSGVWALETISVSQQQFHRDLTGKKTLDVALSLVFSTSCLQQLPHVLYYKPNGCGSPHFLRKQFKDLKRLLNSTTASDFAAWEHWLS